MALARGLGLCAAPEVRGDADLGPRDTARAGQVSTPPLRGLTRGAHLWWPPLTLISGALEMLCFPKMEVTLMHFARCSHRRGLGSGSRGCLCPGLPGAKDEEAPWGLVRVLWLPAQVTTNGEA